MNATKRLNDDFEVREPDDGTDTLVAPEIKYPAGINPVELDEQILWAKYEKLFPRRAQRNADEAQLWEDYQVWKAREGMAAAAREADEEEAFKHHEMLKELEGASEKIIADLESVLASMSADLRAEQYARAIDLLRDGYFPAFTNIRLTAEENLYQAHSALEGLAKIIGDGNARILDHALKSGLTIRAKSNILGRKLAEAIEALPLTITMAATKDQVEEILLEDRDSNRGENSEKKKKHKKKKK